MTKQFDGGTAFPRLDYKPYGDGSGQWHNEGGMSLRDHFAGLAMQGDIAGLSINLYEYTDGELREKAEAAYRMADAMLKAREVKP